MADVIWQLPCGFILPAVGNFFEIKRRKFALDTISEGKVKLRRFIGFTVAQNGSGFAWIMIAVVKEENNLTADFTLQPARGWIFANRKRFGKNPHGCWPKQMIGAVMSAHFATGFANGVKKALQNDA